MEKTPSSVSMGRRRGEMMCMPEKARAWGSGEWLVVSGEWEVTSDPSRLGVSTWSGSGVSVLSESGMRVSLPEMRRPQSWRRSSKRR